MDITEIISKQIDDAAKAAAAPENPAPEDVRQMIDSAVSQVKAEMQAQLDAAKARADDLEKRLNETAAGGSGEHKTEEDNNGDS